jgi:hypothetical protein
MVLVVAQEVARQELQAPGGQVAREQQIRDMQAAM